MSTTGIGRSLCHFFQIKGKVTSFARIAKDMKCSDKQIKQFEKEAARAAEVLKAIGNERRLLILCQLVKEEQTVGQLVEYIGLSNSALSQHLAVLRAKKLVNTRRVSQTIFYSIRSEEVPAIVGSLYELYCAPDKLSKKRSLRKRR